MKEVLKEKTLEPIRKDWCLENGFEKFCLVQIGYAEKFNISTPSKKALETLWFMSTGEKIKPVEEVKKVKPINK